LPTLEVTRDEWQTIIDTVRAAFGIPDYPAYKCYQQYGVCPAGIIYAQSYLYLELYNACDGYRRLQKPEDYWNLPADYVAACQVIDAELQKWESIDGQ